MRSSCCVWRLLIGACVTAWILTHSAGRAGAQRKEEAPSELQGVGVTEHLDGEIPRDTPFVDSDGKPVTLGQFFDGTRPVILTMNYSSCPMLCSLQLNALFQALQAMDWQIGGKFQMVTVGFDPLEAPERAAQTKLKYLKIYGRPGGTDGWHFLTGQEENIKKVARAVGFGYVYVPATRQYAHPAVLMICTPDGRISRYLYGIQYDPQTLRFSLLEAASGKIGSTMDRVLLYCFHYDPQSGRYGPAAANVMRLGGALTVLVLGGLLGFLWIRERRKAGRAKREATS